MAADSSTIHCTNSETRARRTQSKPPVSGSASTSTSTSSSASNTRVSSACGSQSAGTKKSSGTEGRGLRVCMSPWCQPRRTGKRAGAPIRQAERGIRDRFVSRRRQRHGGRPCYHAPSFRGSHPRVANSREPSMSAEKTNQSWGGRFSEPVDAFVARFTASVDFDKRLYKHDIQGSIAHATMLARVGVLNDAERDSIIDGLRAIQSEIEAGQFDWRVDLEDVHMNIEARLTERIGITGKKLHTGRSRNDQVATDIR